MTEKGLLSQAHILQTFQEADSEEGLDQSGNQMILCDFGRKVVTWGMGWPNRLVRKID